MKYRSTNWQQWIIEKFGNKTKYKITEEEDGLIYFVRTTKPHVDTNIIFRFMRPDDHEVLYDIYFSGNDSTQINTWTSPFTMDKDYKPGFFRQLKAFGRLTALLPYSEKLVSKLEKEWLIIPLKYGWTEEVNFVGDKPFNFKLISKMGELNFSKIKNDEYDELNTKDRLNILFKKKINNKRFEFKAME